MRPPNPRDGAPPVGALTYSPLQGFETARYFQPGDDHGAAGVGPAAVSFDGADGRVIGERQPSVGTAADLFVKHSSRYTRVVSSACRAAS